MEKILEKEIFEKKIKQRKKKSEILTKFIYFFLKIKMLKVWEIYCANFKLKFEKYSKLPCLTVINGDAWYFNIFYGKNCISTKFPITHFLIKINK